MAFAGLFSFGLDVYTCLYKMIDSVFPTCLSAQPELSSVTAETLRAREEQLRLHASSVVAGTRSQFIYQICDLVLESQDYILVAINGPTGRCAFSHIRQLSVAFWHTRVLSRRTGTSLHVRTHHRACVCLCIRQVLSKMVMANFFLCDGWCFL